MIKESKPLSVFLSVVLALLVLTTSIAAPILCRSFYYSQIDALDIPAMSGGLNEEQIRTAFDEMMDYCTGKSDRFSTGVLPWSQDGKAHFDDVRNLFILDLVLVPVSILLLALGLFLCLRRKIQPYCFLGRGPGFWGAAGLGGLFAVIGLLAAIDFDRAFVIFHSIFFPGKDNWMFDVNLDAIIRILPQEFFRNCALLILALLVIWCAALIAADLYLGKRSAKRRKELEILSQLPPCCRPPKP